jgi:hypothetical protein
MASIPSDEPDTITAGDTAKWTKSLSDYPASTWTLTYYLVEQGFAGTGINFVATASGNSYLVTVAASVTAGWKPAKYRAFARVSSGSEKYTVWQGQIEVLPNLASPEDYRSHAKKMVDALEEMLLKRAGKELLECEVEGQRFTFKSDESARKELVFWQGIVAGEIAKENAAQGRPTNQRVLTRFTAPT